MNYELPDPVKNPVACLVLSFKVAKGVPHDLASWDKIHWGRSSKSARMLLDICGTFQMANKCIEEIGEQFERQDLTWTLETVVKHSHDWFKKNDRRPHGNDARARLHHAIAERKAKEKAAGDGGLMPAGEILDGIRDLQIIPSEHKHENGGEFKSHG